MKVIKLPLLVTTVLAGLTLVGGIAAADGISNTGPGSDNSITSTTDNNSNTNCSNNVTITGSNLQSAGSGNADVNGNTSGGSANSGNSSNTNISDINVSTGCESLATSQTPPSTPSAPGKGAGSVAGAVVPVSVAGAALPDTGSNTVAEIAFGSVIVLGAALATSRLGVSAYRRLSL